MGCVWMARWVHGKGCGVCVCVRVRMSLECVRLRFLVKFRVEEPLLHF
jgi:hypothetical protein